ncbi:MAG: hypothetical protein AVDCRST_MAG64-888, partial [uncultured Phycisphaerae bacterium]
AQDDRPRVIRSSLAPGACDAHPRAIMRGRWCQHPLPALRVDDLEAVRRAASAYV